MRVSFTFTVTEMTLDKRREERSRVSVFPNVDSRQVPYFVLLQ